MLWTLRMMTMEAYITNAEATMSRRHQFPVDCDQYGGPSGVPGPLDRGADPPGLTRRRQRTQQGARRQRGDESNERAMKVKSKKGGGSRAGHTHVLLLAFLVPAGARPFTQFNSFRQCRPLSHPALTPTPAWPAPAGRGRPGGGSRGGAPPASRGRSRWRPPPRPCT